MLFLPPPICGVSYVRHLVGPVAEWLGRALQKLLHRFESGRDLFTKAVTRSQSGFFFGCVYKYCWQTGFRIQTPGKEDLYG